MADLVIRDVTPADTDAVVRLRRLESQATDEATHARIVSGETVPLVRQRVAEIDGELVGYAVVSRPGFLGGNLSFNVVVEPGYRGQGVGSALHRDIASAMAGELTVTSVADNDTRTLAIVQHWGFDPHQRGVASVLRLREPAPHPTLPPGITMDTITHWDVPDDLAEAWLASDTSPEAIVLGAAGAHDYAAMFDAPVIVWASVDGVAAALASAHRQSDEEWAVIYTGTTPLARGRGLARLVKQELHAQAWEAGVQRVTTVNEASNTGIRALNAAMGYEPDVGDIRLRLDLRS